MRQVPIDEVKNDLSGYLQVAEKESVIITRDGQPVGILIGLEDALILVGRVIAAFPRL